MEQASKTRLYFAYGSNLNLSLMRQKCAKSRVLGIARLADHRIGFYGYSVTWDGAVETVVPDPQSEVWGVLYQLESFDWERLDNCEDVRADGTGEYFHYPVEVVDAQQQVYEASIYKKARLGTAETPTEEYLALIIQGAQEQGLPDAYIKSLQQISTQPASYDVPRRPVYGRVGLQGGCSGCEG